MLRVMPCVELYRMTREEAKTCEREKMRGAASFRIATPRAWREATQHDGIVTQYRMRAAQCQDARVRVKGVEPSRACAPHDAIVLRLPVPPHPHRLPAVGGHSHTTTQFRQRAM